MFEKKSPPAIVRRILQIGIIILLNVFIILCAEAGLFGNSSGAFSPQKVYALSKRGSQGDETLKIQSVLKGAGLYKGELDGRYGKQTERAVREFQKSNKLNADGVAGKETLGVMGFSDECAFEEEILARIIYAESRGEPYDGQVAVGAVVINRVNHPNFPDTISEVIFQKGAFSGVKTKNWQNPISRESIRAAKEALSGADPSSGAIYFYNPELATDKWIRARPVIKSIGNHLFCA